MAKRIVLKAETVEQTELASNPIKQDKKKPGRPSTTKSGYGKAVNLNIDPEIATEFKLESITRGMSQKQLFETMFKYYVKNVS